jgi:hypothetical protein
MIQFSCLVIRFTKTLGARFIAQQICICVLIALCSCVTSGDTVAAAESQLAKTTAELLSVDFGSLVDNSCYVTFANYGQEGQSRLAGLHLRDLQECSRLQKPVADLSEAELRACGTYVVPGKQFVNQGSLFQSLVAFYNTTGRLPLNGLELSNTATSESLTELSSITDMQEYTASHIMGINPISGKFYRGFAVQEWAPGEVLLECIDDPDVVKEQIGNLMLDVHPTDSSYGKEPAKRIWRMRIWGESESSVLIDAEYWTP